MVTHDSRKKEHCAVEKNKAKTISKLLDNSLKTNNIIVSVLHSTLFVHGNGRRHRLLFTRAYISLKSKPADSALFTVQFAP